MKACGVIALLCVLASAWVSSAETGRELYEAACASCHGRDGRGAPEGTAITVALPDLSDCSFVTRETTENWVALVAEGGPALGLSSQMPGFGDALSDDQARSVIAYLRGFCADPSWPHADLNFRRPLFTGKAFPEDEAVVTLNFEKARQARSLVSEWSVEKRLWARGQAELAVPSLYHDPGEGATAGGVGDLTVAYKHVLLASERYGTVGAFSLDLVLPTGERDRGLGDGTVILGPSLRAGKALGRFVLQGEIKAILPIEIARAPRRLLYRAAVQFPISPLRRGWVPGLEFEADTKVEGRGQDTYALAPVLYKGLTRSGHVAFAVGAKIPVAGSKQTDYQIGAFLLWEFLEGGLWW